MFDPEYPDEIYNWTDTDLLSLPVDENDRFEYTGSSTRPSDLERKLWRSASAFWNSGGGLLLVGVDNNGRPDGGIDPVVGNQSRVDWATRHIGSTSHPGPVALKTIERSSAESGLDSGKVVLAVAFGISTNPPHRGKDNKYYFRLAGESRPAPHHVVEGMRTRTRPDLRLRAEARIEDNAPVSHGVVRFAVELHLTNIGGAVAQLPCLTLKTLSGGWSPIGTSHQISSAALPRGFAPKGFWLRAAGTRASPAFYPGDDFYVGGLRFDVHQADLERNGPLTFDYITTSEDGRLYEDSTSVDLTEVRQRLAVYSR